MKKSFWIFIIALVFLASAIFYYRQVKFSKPSQKLANFSEQKIHYYKDENVDLTKIRIKAVYFVPKNKVSDTKSDWQNLLKNVLSRMAEFHKLQFKDLSQISFDIYPKMVLGLENNLVYDTKSTKFGNPRALLAVSGEIEKRIFNPKGDLYNKDFAKLEKNEFESLFIMYEGVAASGVGKEGGLPTAFVARGFLTDKGYKVFGDSTFYHEFAHTIGILDLFDAKTNKPFSEDIMGSGRFRPLEINYIDARTKAEMGLAE